MGAQFDHADRGTVAAMTEAMRAWRTAHPCATFAEIGLDRATRADPMGPPVWLHQRNPSV